jgi:hypothetical protein
MKKLVLDEIRVESFSTTPADAERKGTVQAHDTLASSPCDPSCQYGTCLPHECDTESINQNTCDYTCGDNYGCATVDPRCTHGGVYMC